MATLELMYPARGGLVLGQMMGCYLTSGVNTPGGLYNILVLGTCGTCFYEPVTLLF